MLKKLVEHVVKTLVLSPDSVIITQRDHEGRQVLHISVDKADLGKVIGREGQTIKAIRSLVIAVKDESSAISDVIIDSA